MWPWRIIGLIFASLATLWLAPIASAQSPKQETKLDEMVRNLLKVPGSQETPLSISIQPENLPVRVLYDGKKLAEDLTLEVTLSKPNPNGVTAPSIPLSASTLFLSDLAEETELVLTWPQYNGALQVDAKVRDINRNLILQAEQPIPIKPNEVPVLTLTATPQIPKNAAPVLDFAAVETITGTITLPKKTTLPKRATLYVQLLENALAGGTSMKLAAEHIMPLSASKAEIPFALQLGIWDHADDPDMVFKAWIADAMGRKIFVMNAPVGYNGPDIDYEVALDSLKQGKETRRGQNLPEGLMAQTLVQGEAAFDPVNGIPGAARLKIVLKQDRGDYNHNPILAEQTLILRGMETRIPFSLTTDSTHFDPYAPAPFLSVSLTDSYGRVYYASGEIRARESRNNLRLFPR